MKNWHFGCFGLALCGIIGAGSVGCTRTSGDSAAVPQTSSATYAGAYPIQILCTTAQVADMLQAVAGEKAVVTSLMGAGVDPHLYKAAPSDRVKFSRADIIFYNGMHLEARLADLLVQLARTKPTVAVTAGLVEADDARLREPAEFAGHYDPHLWHDAALWADCATYAAEQLAAFDPAHADEYRQNAAAYHKSLLALHERAKTEIAAIPAAQRVLITAHDAFGYFGQAYDVQVRGLQGISTVDEPDVAAMQELVELLVNNKIKAVFVESSVPRRNVESLIEAAADRGHAVRIGGELYSDAMGVEGTPEATYVGMFEHNVRTIVDALK